MWQPRWAPWGRLVKVLLAPADLENAEVSVSSVRSAPRILLWI